jgi:hypothetical protein
MSLLALNKVDAIQFIIDRLDMGADSVIVTANSNGTFQCTATFTPAGAAPTPTPPPPPQGAP